MRRADRLDIVSGNFVAEMARSLDGELDVIDEVRYVRFEGLANRIEFQSGSPPPGGQ